MIAAARHMTPQLARERARMGALRARTAPRTIAGDCLCMRPVGRAPGTIGYLGALGDASLLSTADYSAQLQARLSAQTSSVKAQIAAATGTDVTNATTTQGAQSAAGLIQNGYNPDSASDNANLVHVVAGGLALIPGAGPILAGAVEGLWVVGNAAACPLENAFSSVGIGSPSPACGGKVCTTSGSWTPANVLAANKGALPAIASRTGSFANLVTAALAMYAAQSLNCKGGFPAVAVVDGIVALWNQTHAGPAVPVYVPALLVQPGTGAPGSLLIGGAGVHPSGTSAPAKAGQVPNVFYAFDSAALLSGYLGQDVTKPSSGFTGWATFALSGVTAPPGLTLTAPRTVMINVGALTVPAPRPARTINLHLGPLPSSSDAARAPSSRAAVPMSTGAKVAAAGAAAGAGALLWWLGKNGWKWRTPRFARGLRG